MSSPRCPESIFTLWQHCMTDALSLIEPVLSTSSLLARPHYVYIHIYIKKVCVIYAGFVPTTHCSLCKFVLYRNLLHVYVSCTVVRSIVHDVKFLLVSRNACLFVCQTFDKHFSCVKPIIIIFGKLSSFLIFASSVCKCESVRLCCRSVECKLRKAVGPKYGEEFLDLLYRHNFAYTC